MVITSVLRSLVVDLAYYIQQSIFECILLCIVSLQLFQVMSILQTEALREWRDEMLVTIHRIFVLLIGLPFGIFVCQSGGGICRSMSIYYYLFQGSKKKEKFEDSILSVISVVIFAIIIISCQTVVEIKRFQMNKKDKNAERTVILALKEINKARMRMNTNPTLEIQAPNPALSIPLSCITEAELITDESGQSPQTMAKLTKQQVNFYFDGLYCY